MKRKLVIMLAVVSALAMTACGNNKETIVSEDDGSENSDAASSSATENSSQATREASAEAGGEASADESDNDENAADAELVAKVVEAAGAKPEEARFYVADDYDGDGSREAFVYIGDELDVDWSTCYGSVWFVNNDGCERLRDSGNFQAFENEMFYLYKEDGRTFIKVSDAYVTEAVSYVYYVDGGKCKESVVSGVGDFFKTIDTGEYKISKGAYDRLVTYENGKDSESMGTGHTWKNYYLYYDKSTGDFKEYVGKDITEAELNKACGFDLASEIRNEGYQIDAIYKRDNGIINVNYSKETHSEDGTIEIEYKNVTFDEKTHEFVNVWGDGENTWQNSDFGGVYLPSLLYY